MAKDKLIRKVQYKLYPSKTQERRLDDLFVHHHHLYNFSLKDRINTYKEFGYGLSYNDQWAINKQYRDRRKAHGIFNANAQSEQNTLKRVDRAFKNFFARLNRGEKGGFPRLRSFDRFSGWGYNSHGDGWKLHLKTIKHGAVYLADVGIVKMRGQARNEGGKPKTAEVIKRHDGWYLSVAFEYESISRQSGENATALDWGVEHYATLVNHQGQARHIANPRIVNQAREKLTDLQRQLALAKKKSRSWRYLKKRIAKLHGDIANKRKNFIHQTTNAIVGESALLTFEKLEIRNITRTAKGTAEKHGKRVKQKSGLNRAILDTAPSLFMSQLKNKAEEAGCLVMIAPTKKLKPSQTCPSCGTVKKKELSERLHACSCGYTAQRDVASAQVVLDWAFGLEARNEPIAA